MIRDIIRERFDPTETNTFLVALYIALGIAVAGVWSVKLPSLKEILIILAMSLFALGIFELKRSEVWRMRRIDVFGLVWTFIGYCYVHNVQTSFWTVVALMLPAILWILWSIRRMFRTVRSMRTGRAGDDGA